MNETLLKMFGKYLTTYPIKTTRLLELIKYVQVVLYVFSLLIYVKVIFWIWKLSLVNSVNAVLIIKCRVCIVNFYFYLKNFEYIL